MLVDVLGSLLVLVSSALVVAVKSLNEFFESPLEHLALHKLLDRQLASLSLFWSTRQTDRLLFLNQRRFWLLVVEVFGHGSQS